MSVPPDQMGGMVQGPPGSPEELKERETGWDRFLTTLEQTLADPRTNALLARMGAELARPLGPGMHHHQNVTNAIIEGRGAGTVEDQRLFENQQLGRRTDIAADRNVIAREVEEGRSTRQTERLQTEKDLQTERLALQEALAGQREEGLDRRQGRALGAQSQEGAATRELRALIASGDLQMRGRELEQRWDQIELVDERERARIDAIDRLGRDRLKFDAAGTLLNYEAAKSKVQADAEVRGEKFNNDLMLEIVKAAGEEAAISGEPVTGKMLAGRYWAVQEAMNPGSTGTGDPQYGSRGRPLGNEVADAFVKRTLESDKTLESVMTDEFRAQVGPAGVKEIEEAQQRLIQGQEDEIPRSRTEHMRRLQWKQDAEARRTRRESKVGSAELAIDRIEKEHYRPHFGVGPVVGEDLPWDQVDELWQQLVGVIDEFGAQSDLGKKAQKQLKRLQRLVDAKNR